MRICVATVLVTGLAASTAHQDMAETVDQHIVPGYAALASATDDLAVLAVQTCDLATLRPA